MADKEQRLYTEGLTNGYAAGYKRAQKDYTTGHKRRVFKKRLYKTWVYQQFCHHIGRENVKPYPTVKELQLGKKHPQVCCKCEKQL